MAQNIFVEKKIACPACKTGFQLKYPNPKVYAATGRDVDQRVKGYSWTGGIKTDVQPHYFSVLQCPTCFVADFYQTLETPPGYGTKVRKVFPLVVDLPFDRRMILRKLRRLVPEGELDLQGAMVLHLAAIFCTLLPGKKEELDHMKLGRLFLRLSWLYNEFRGPDAGDEPRQPAATADNAIKKLIHAVDEVEDELNKASDSMINIRKLTLQRMEELKLPAEANPYNTLVTGVEENIDLALQELEKLQEIVTKDKNKILTIKKEVAHADNVVADATTLEELLPELLTQWPQLPQNEKNALKLAVEAFDYSVKHEAADQSVQQNMVLANLTLQLMLKMGDLNGALAYCLNIYKSCFSDKQRLQTELNEGKRTKSLKQEEAKKMTRMLTFYTNTLGTVAEDRKKILGLLFERDEEKIFAVLKANAAAPPQEKIQALKDEGFPDELISLLKDKGMFLEENDKTKKKKWFGK
ncbi:MAG: DUF2225 domain-containing protein [bacterium]|nr:DUF2225 domain-containing protein [bacterium]